MRRFFLFLVLLSQISLAKSADLNSYCYDVHYYELKIKVDIQNRSINGSNKIYFSPQQNLSVIQIHLYQNLQIDSIKSQGNRLSYTRDNNSIFIHFPNTLNKHHKESVEIFYNGKPIVATNPPWDGGFVWTKDSLNNDWIAVACEGKGASLWWPCKDVPSDEPDSLRISVTCPSHLTCVSNGVLEKVSVEESQNTFTWAVHYPINNYNITLNIGKYAHFSDLYKREDSTSLALDYYVLTYNLEKAKIHFEQVKKILTAYESYFGNYPFPKDGYALVETPYWGMEHQSAIAYGNNFKNNLGSFDFIIAHESAHEWWGNSVTAADLGELWIHESFATYAESLLLEYYFGKEVSLKYLEQQKSKIKNDLPMLLPPGSFNPDDTDIYYKGAWMLHTIRSIINNDKTWKKLLLKLATCYKHKIVNTSEVISFFNKCSGKNLSLVFDQYLKHTSIPTLEYSFAKKKGKTIMEYKWVSEVKKLKMPVWIEVGSKKILVKCKTKSKKIDLGEISPEVVRIMAELEYIAVKKL